LVIQDPIQLSECGHRQCESCANLQKNTIITCSVCQVQTPTHLVMIDRGFKNEMKSLLIQCIQCQWTGQLQEYHEHLTELHPHPICQHCSQQFNSFDELNQHKLLQCQQLTTDCLLKDFGCHQQIVRGKKQEHFQTQQHQQTILKIVHQMIAQQQNSLSDTTTANTSTSDLAEDVEDALGILMNGIEALVDEEQRLTQESLQIQLQLQALAEHASQVKLSIQESRSYLDGVKQNFDILKQDLSSLDEKINDRQCISYDGTFIWKINNVKEKMNDARSERQTSIYSSPFYSSPTGYKMRLRLYLNGDGNARQTHLSLFFVLMRGMNDAVLKFPFTNKVTFCLYDQSGRGRHAIDSFRPDIRSNSFQRPRCDMNIASGIPKFIKLSALEEENNGYVVDDTMFIKVMVDFDDIPKTLLPYAMCLNPGVPTYVQQLLIKQEGERRTQRETSNV